MNKKMGFFSGALTGAGLTAAGQSLVGFLGFTKAGVAAGSIAASVQGPAVAAGSTFATLQSVGATGALITFAPVAAIVGGGVVAGAIYLKKK